MTVNWEREPGERIEEFAASYLLLDAGIGNQIRPSQGDKGIDVQIPTVGGRKIYQVKRFAKNLGSTEKRHIENSWKRFQKEVLPLGDVVSWSLVLPLEPTTQNLEWLTKLTQDSGIAINWVGRAQLDAWAASSPRLREYFFGDGGQRWHELMAQALAGGRNLDATDGEPLLSSVGERMTYLGAALDEVDPFYRYEMELRTGSLKDEPPLEALQSASRPDLVESIFQTIDEDHYLVTHVIARSAVSTILRPIQGRLRFPAATDEERDSLEKFFLYGSPVLNARATVESSEGPPGTTIEPGTSGMAWTITPSTSEKLPPLEVRLRQHSVQVASVTATSVSNSAAVSGDGQWWKVELGSAATFEFFIGAKGHPNRVQLTTNRAIGSSPSDVLPGLQLVAEMPGTELELGVKGGLAIASGFAITNNKSSSTATEYAKFVEALALVQQFTFEHVVIPDIGGLHEQEVLSLMRTAALLRGETVSGTFSEFEVTGEDFFTDWDNRERSLTVEKEIDVRLGQYEWPIIMRERQEFESVRLDREGDRLLIRAGRSNKVRAVAIHPPKSEPLE